VRSKQIVDPEPVPMLDQVLSLLPSFSATMENIPQLRAFQKETARLQQSLVPAFLTITVTEGSLPGPQGPDVRVLVYVPRNVPTPMPALLWIHGGYISGSPEGEDAQVKTIVSTVGCAAVSVDYRLAPETPHPGPVEDCYDALKWLYTTSRLPSVGPAQAVGSPPRSVCSPVTGARYRRSSTYTFTSRLAAATELTWLDTGPRKVISFTGVFRTGMQITAKL